MAVTPGNIVFGPKVGDSSVITVGGTDVGFVEGGVGIRVPREYAYLGSDMYPVHFDHVMVMKELFVTAQLSEMSQGNIQYVIDNDAAAAGVLTIDDDVLDEFALVVNTNPPTGSSTRAISVPKAVAVGEGTWNLPVNNKQTIDAEWKAIGDTSATGKLATITDA